MSFPDSVLQLIEKYQLGPVVRWILENNPSQALPYHNLQHSLYVMFYAEKCWDSWRWGFEKECPVHVLLAALFHDFGHSGGLFPDGKNVEIAADAFRYFHFHNERKREPYISPDAYHVDMVANLILATEYPHELECLTADRMCLLDADMMQYCNDTLFGCLVGIRSECFRYTGWDEYLEKTIEFLDGIAFHTPYGKENGTAGIAEARMRVETFKTNVWEIPRL